MERRIIPPSSVIKIEGCGTWQSNEEGNNLRRDNNMVDQLKSKIVKAVVGRSTKKDSLPNQNMGKSKNNLEGVGEAVMRNYSQS